MRRAVVLLALIAGLLAGCAERPSLRIGYLEGQPISALMAHTVAETLRHAGARTVLTACPNLVACGRQLQAEDIDLLSEYSGSARAFLRNREIAEGDPDAVRQTLRRIGLDATPSLGFRAPYRLMVRADGAGDAEIATIEDLSRLDRPKFAVPPGYPRQPGDGLYALARRYGLTVAPEQVREVVRPGERLARLLSGDVQVALVRAPYVERNENLRALEDTLGFFPRYEAMVMLGRRASERAAFVEAALRPLYGALAAHEVQPLLTEQVLQGRDPATQARRLLVAEGVLDASGPSVRRPEMVLAKGTGETLGALEERALLTLRRAFPERPVEMLTQPDPMAALAEGRASLALVHTSDFFRLGPDGGFDGRDPRGEAIAAVGRRPVVLLVRRAALEDGGNPLAGEVGIQPAWTAGGRVAARMLAMSGGRAGVRAAPGQLLSALRAAELDAAIVLLDPAARAALQELEGNAIRVEGLSDWLAAPPFFLNAERLPATAIPGALAPVDTLSMQLVLAGPAPEGRSGPVHGGPSSAVATGGLPLPLREAEALAAANESPEPLDPVLPTYEERAAAQNAGRRPDRELLETGLILGALAYMAWAFSLLVRPGRRP